MVVENTKFDNSGFEAITTSYDYDAPLNENGDYTDKYYIFKELVTAANPVETLLPDQPVHVAPVAYEAIRIQYVIPIKTLLNDNAPVIVFSENVIAMEKLDINDGSGQSNGYIVYRKENVDLRAQSVLTIEG